MGEGVSTQIVRTVFYIHKLGRNTRKMAESYLLAIESSLVVSWQVLDIPGTRVIPLITKVEALKPIFTFFGVFSCLLFGNNTLDDNVLDRSAYTKRVPKTINYRTVSRSQRVTYTIPQKVRKPLRVLIPFGCHSRAGPMDIHGSTFLVPKTLLN